MEPRKRSVQVILRSGIERPTPLLRTVARRTMEAHGLEGRVSILLTNDDEIARLNAQFRSVPVPTDVLTFDWHGEDGLCGELVISVETASRQAGMRKVALPQELALLAMHGVLHLAGFDDETASDRAIMQAEMARLASEFGLPADPEWTSLHYHEAPLEQGSLLR